MTRNLDHRVETCFPIENPKHIIRVRRELSSYLSDNTRSFVMAESGEYERRYPVRNQKERNAQLALLETLAI